MTTITRRARWLTTVMVMACSDSGGETDGGSDASNDATLDVAPDTTSGDASADATFDAEAEAAAPCTTPLDAAVVFDAGGATLSPVVAWAHQMSNNGGSIYVKRWNGSSWDEIGGTTNVVDPSNHAVTPQVAIGPDGNPAVAWLEFGQPSQIFFKRWNGSAWEELAGSASAGGLSNVASKEFASGPSIAIDHEGRFVVAWNRNITGAAYVYLRRWNGCSWEELGGSATGSGVGVGYFPSVAIDPSDRPVVVWSPVDCQVAAARWNGTSWVAFGDSLDDGGLDPTHPGGNPRVAIGADGNPVVARIGTLSSTPQLVVDAWNGTSWSSLDAGAAGQCFSGAPLPVAIDDAGRPVVAAYGAGGSLAAMHTYAWTGTQWQELVGMATFPRGDLPSIANDTRGITEAWLGLTSVDAGWQIYASQWSGSAWQDLGGSTSGGGLSNGPGFADGGGSLVQLPSVAGWPN